MTLDKAIEWLEAIHSDRRYKGVGDRYSGQVALSLGIEALKRIKRQSPNRALPGTELLPGETEEGERSSLTDAEREIVDREYKAGCEQLRQWYAEGKLSGGEHGNP